MEVGHTSTCWFQFESGLGPVLTEPAESLLRGIDVQRTILQGEWFGVSFMRGDMISQTRVRVDLIGDLYRERPEQRAEAG